MIEFLMFVLATFSSGAIIETQAEISQAQAPQLQLSQPLTAEGIEALSVDVDNDGDACEGQTFASAEEALQSGCCSWHGGVCGCQNGRKVCCDRTLSPSCRC